MEKAWTGEGDDGRKSMDGKKGRMREERWEKGWMEEGDDGRKSMEGKK